MVYQVSKEAAYDEVFDSQKTYKILLDSMSRPGKICQLEKHSFVKAPEGFNPYVLSIFKVLSDNMVSFSIFQEAPEFWRHYLVYNTGAQNAKPENADFVLFQGDIFDQSFSQMKTGNLEFPEDSTTAIISVDLLEPCCNPQSLEVQVKGPGVQSVNSFGVSGLDGRYFQIRAEMNALFPLGIDVILVDKEGKLVSLPRTCQTEVK